jgi:hypothetical protein
VTSSRSKSSAKYSLAERQHETQGRTSLGIIDTGKIDEGTLALLQSDHTLRLCLRRHREECRIAETRLARGSSRLRQTPTKAAVKVKPKATLWAACSDLAGVSAARPWSVVGTDGMGLSRLAAALLTQSGCKRPTRSV